MVLLHNVCVGSRAWIGAGWVFIAAAAGLAIAGIVLVLGTADRVCVQPAVPGEVTNLACPGTGTEFFLGLICAVLAGVAFFSSLACFFWAAHLRTLRALSGGGSHDA